MLPVPAESRERVGMKILSDLKLEYCEELDEADKKKVSRTDAEKLPKASSQEERIGAAGFDVGTADENAKLSEILKMKLSDFKNTDKPLKVFSRLFGEEIHFSPSVWITHKLELKKYGLPIYTAQELIKIVKDSDPENLKIIHKAKKVFAGNLLKIEGVGDAY